METKFLITKILEIFKLRSLVSGLTTTEDTNAQELQNSCQVRGFGVGYKHYEMAFREC